MLAISDPFSISNPVGEYIISRTVYRDRVVSIYHRETLVDLIELDMVDFDVILGLDWHHSYYVSLVGPERSPFIFLINW